MHELTPTERRRVVEATLRCYERALRGTPSLDLIDLIVAVREHQPDLPLATARQLVLRSLAGVLTSRPSNHSVVESILYNLFPTASRVALASEPSSNPDRTLK